MDIAALVCNNKIDYDLAFQPFAIYEYLKRQGNQTQIIDYNFLIDKGNKKNEMLYNFLSDNIMLTLNRYKTLNQLEENVPLADKFIIVNGTYNELAVKVGNGDNIAYRINNISLMDVNLIEKQFDKISYSYNFNADISKKVVDPIFLLSEEEWYELINEKSKIKIEYSSYVLLYTEVVTADILKYARVLAQKYELQIIVITDKVKSFLYNCKRLKNVEPFDFANLIANAHDVITSCDDAIKLSVMFERNLHIFTNGQNEQIELIEKLGISDRIVRNNEQLISNLINFDVAKSEISLLQNNSYEFLKIDK